MLYIILIIIAIVVIVRLKNKSDVQKVESGGHNYTVNLLASHYSVVRDHIDELGCGQVISAGTYWFELDGKVSSSSSYMSVCVHQTNSGEYPNEKAARNLGMDVKTMENKKYFQFVVKIPCNRTVKREILKKLKVVLSEKYPDDFFDLDETIPALFGTVGMARIMRSFK